MNINIFVDMDGVLCRCVDVEKYSEDGNKYAIKMINDINNSKGSWLSKEGNFIVYSKKTSYKVKSIENLAKSFL